MLCIAMTITAPGPSRVHLVALIRSKKPDLIEQVTRRFEIEFGIEETPETSGSPQNQTSQGASPSTQPAGESGGESERWLALERRVSPGQLPALQNHAMRIEALYLGESGDPEIEIHLGYITETTVVRAARSGSPRRIYLGRGVWGEIALVREPGMEYRPPQPSDSSWSSPRGVAFLNAVASRDGEGSNT